MTVEVLPVGTKCGLVCRHCYQHPIRDAGNQETNYDLHAMKRALSEEGKHFSVFGGEPLLTPIEDLEELWRWGMERFGRNSVQTSGAAITDYHLELFKKYNVSVGISLEGPGELNDIRWAGSLERTRECTAHSEKVLKRLLDRRHPVSLITTLNRANARPDRLRRLLDWYRWLDTRDLRNVNLHLLEIENEKVRKDWALTEKENTEALLACSGLQSELTHLRFQPILDMTQLLLGDDSQTTCTWGACDPYTTRAVRGINSQGDRVNCSRVNKAGIDMLKCDRELLIRPLALYHVAQDHGGCNECKFWFACKGGCPGQSIGGDWRRKSEHCKTLQSIFKTLEKRLAAVGFRPISLDHRRELVEARMLEAFSAGNPISVKRAMTDEAPASSKDNSHGDNDHGDRGHGDHGDVAKPIISHGDHTDAG